MLKTYILFSLLFSAISIQVFSQKQKEITIFYDNFWKETTKENAHYYSVLTAVNVHNYSIKKGHEEIEEFFEFNKKSNRWSYPGKWMENAYTSNGTLLISGEYFMGFYDKTWYRYYPTGELKSIDEYKMGKNISSTSYYLNGNKKYENSTSFYKNGSVKTEKIVLGKDSTLHITYFNSGEIETKSYKSNSKTVVDSSYYKNGNLFQSGTYTNGKVTERSTYREDESVYKKQTFSNDTTYATFFEPSGSLAKETIVFKSNLVQEKVFTDYQIEEKVSNNSTEVYGDTYTVVEFMPYFLHENCKNTESRSDLEQCAQTELLKYIGKVTYPYYAIENDIESREFIRFVVDIDGSVIDVESAKGNNSILTESAIRHIEAMPKWEPGMQRGKKVKVQYVVPINFKLG